MKDFDPALVNLKVSEGPLPGTWIDGNGNMHLAMPEICAYLGLPIPQTDEEKRRVNSAMAAILRDLVPPDVAIHERVHPEDV